MSSAEAIAMDGAWTEDFCERLSAHGAEMIALARASIRHGLAARMPLSVSAADHAPLLREPAASFVTLRIAGELRGCIGSAEACRPLFEDLSHNGFMAAFHDPRFPPLTAREFGITDVEVSVLSPPAPLPFEDEADLLSGLVPGRDGLVLELGALRGLFLPQVWDALPDAGDFLRHLKQKAGLPDGPLNPAVCARRFVAAKFTDESTG